VTQIGPNFPAETRPKEKDRCRRRSKQATVTVGHGREVGIPLEMQNIPHPLDTWTGGEMLGSHDVHGHEQLLCKNKGNSNVRTLKTSTTRI
jgi:hypothetical protein